MELMFRKLLYAKQLAAKNMQLEKLPPWIIPHI